MKLFIVKDQAKGFLGGVKFEMTGRVELTPDEVALVRRYKVEKEVLLQKEIKIPFTGKAVILNLTIGSLMEGQHFKCADFAEIVAYEDNLKVSCQNFSAYLELMRNFGGEEVIEFGGPETRAVAKMASVA